MVLVTSTEIVRMGWEANCCIADYQAVGPGYLVTALQRLTNCTVILA